ncbi:transcription intermediary factor 1-beta-like [Saccostrea cucullata]|uniref:transcription intermediary factor 1-beta-like n=1 Tax=Saccostrea cuccullata TaxID=36930 RepID=UPI002ED09C6B
MTATEWTENLPTNHVMMRLIDYESNKTIGNEILCDPCKFANEKTKAKVHCHECKEYFCEQCLSYLHKRKRDNNTHTITTITEDMPLKPFEVDELCPVHSGKVLEAYCFDHGNLCCSLCFMTNHRKCDVKSLDEIANDKKEDLNMDDFISKLVETEQSTESLIKDKNEKIAQLDKNKEEILQTVNGILSDTKSHLDSLYEEFKKSTEKTFLNSEENQKDYVEWLVGFQKTLINCRRMANAVREHGSGKQIFVTKERLKFSLEKHFQRMTLSMQYSGYDEQYEADIEEELSEIQRWSKLASLKGKKLDKHALRNFEKTMGSLTERCNKFLCTIPVQVVSFPQHSVPFQFLGKIWRIECTKDGSSLGMYLELISGDKSDCSRYVSAELRIIHTSDNTKDKVQKFTHRFSEAEPDWGYESFINWIFLVSKSNGFISNGLMKIQVKLTQP